MQTMQQRRAQFALRAVRRAENDPRIDNDEYKRYAAGLPAMIHINRSGNARVL